MKLESPFFLTTQSSPYSTLRRNFLIVPQIFHSVSSHCDVSFLPSPTLFFCFFLFLLIPISASHPFLSASYCLFSVFCSFIFLSCIPSPLSCSIFLFSFPLFTFLSLLLNISEVWALEIIVFNCVGLWIFYISQSFWEIKYMTQFLVFFGFFFTLYHWPEQ